MNDFSNEEYADMHLMYGLAEGFKVEEFRIGELLYELIEVCGKQGHRGRTFDFQAIVQNLILVGTLAKTILNKMGKVVKMLYGAVEGCEGTDLDGNKFHKFLGIPYAKPPIGDLRFKDPQPADSWIGIRDATKEGSACYHKSDFTQKIEGSEDCLYLNVFTRDIPDESDNLKPVMVWIHGGAFLAGSSSQELFGAEFLLSEDVVLVTINYRLGLLGFLQIKDPSLNVTGNMGFKDQVEALRWVKDNIQQFNGNPDNVTIFGESAGSASVHYHVLSPLSRDLFHKAILQSGAALDSWADQCDHSAVQIAKVQDPTVSTQAEALKVLKSLPVEELYKVQTTFLSKVESGSIRPIGLVIEPASKRVAFMNKKPIDIITSGEYNKVPMIFGYNNREGLLFNEFRKREGDTRKVVAEYFIPHNINLKRNEAVKKNYVNKINNLYFNGPDEDDNISLLITDSWFLAGIYGSVKNHAQTSAYPVYLYKLSLETKLNIVKTILNISHVFGCSHADDIGYLFKTIVSPPIEPGSIEDISLRRILKLWTNFARFGNPTPDETELGITWKPVMARQINALHIREDLKMEINPDSKRIDLWRELYHQSPATIKYL